MRLVALWLAFIGALLLSGCGSGGLLNLNPQPTGNIVLSNATSGAVLQTTQANPFIVTGGGFSIGMTEDHFSGPYTVVVSAWTATFNVPCFVPHYIDQTDKTNVVKFTADYAAPVTAPTQPSPCNSWILATGAIQTDEETAQISDTKGHTVTLFYKLAGATAASGGGSTTPTSTVPTRVSVGWSGASPSATTCGAYVLNVGAVNASGTAVPTTASNPITLSTTGSGYMGFATGTAASAASFTCPSTLGTGSPGGSATLQLTTTPAQILVYFNGPASTALTTITASSVGLTAASVAVANAAFTTATKLAVSWSGPSPTGSACGAYILNVGALSATGAAIATTAANPITLSTTGGGYMGFSAASATSADFTCPQSTNTPPVGSPGGTATLNVTSTPAQVLVYFNGFNAAATTTITAASVGFTPAVQTIANAQSTIVASIKLAWNGAVPTPANCGAFNLKVQAFDINGNLIVSSQYSNPINLSTNSAIWSGFSTVVAGISPAPPPNSLLCSPPNLAPVVGTPTLNVPDTATPTVIYYDGPYAGGNATTISASAQGVPVQNITISF